MLACLMALLVLLFKVLPTSFVPNEDQGYVLSAVFMPSSASLNRTAEVGEKVDALFAKNPAVESRSEINGYSLLDGQYKTNAATFFVKLKDFKERYGSWATAKVQNAKAVLLGVAGLSRDIPQGRLIPIAPPGDSGYRHHRRF